MVVEEQQHFDLTRAEDRGDRLRNAAATAGAVAYLVEEPSRDLARQGSFAVRDSLEEPDDALRRLGLHQVARRAGTDRSQEVLVGPGRREHDALASRRRLAQPGERVEPAHARHREIEQDEIGEQGAGRLDRIGAVGRLADDAEAVLLQQRRERAAGQGMVVHDQDPQGHVTLIGRNRSAEKSQMRRDDADYQSWLWGEVLLLGLLGATLALFLTYPSLRSTYELPQARLVIDTTIMLAAGIVAVLAGLRFSVEARRFDLLLCAGFAAAGASVLAFSILPVLGGQPLHRAEAWARVGGRLVAATLIAAAPYVHGRVKARPRALANAIGGLALALMLVWVLANTASSALPPLALRQGDSQPALLTAALALQALLSLAALIGFGLRFRSRGQDLDRWLALAMTLKLFAELHYVFTPLVSNRFVSQGDFLRLLAYGVLLVGVWRAIRSAEFGRAVAEERARVAREIHDGLAQYLFAVSTHASMLESGADPETTLPQLRQAAAAAQQEARFAILALSSASGTAPFDAALRRYVEFLTADGELEV